MPKRAPRLFAAALAAVSSFAAIDASATDGLREEAERLVREAERDPSTRDAKYEAAGNLYLQIWKDHGQRACEARQLACARMEEVLYNAARAYQAAHQVFRSIEVREVLLDPRYHLSQTPIAVRAQLELGGTFHALAEYERAASTYEAFARAHPKHEEAPRALQDAIVMRLALGDDGAAESDAALYQKHHGAKRPRDAQKIAFALASDALDHGRPEAAQRLFSTAMPGIDRGGQIDLQIQAHTGLARALRELGKRREAAAEYDKVRAAYRDPRAVMAKLDKLPENASLRVTAKVLTAVGEAVFFAADEKARAVDAIKVPVYRGPAARDRVLAFMGDVVPRWIADERRAVEEAERAYSAVLAMQPIPPPKWAVAAAARVARMRGRLAAQIRSLPAPKGLNSLAKGATAEAWALWDEARERASEADTARAKAAYRTCAALSIKMRWMDARSKTCWAWLTRHYPHEYPALDEIADAPTRLSDGIVVTALPDPRRE